jgi:hypothetical protein
MIQVASDDLKSKIKLDSVRHADLKVSILNAPHSFRNDEKLFTIDQFLDKETVKEIFPEKKVTKISKSSAWSAAGRAYVQQFENQK